MRVVCVYKGGADFHAAHVARLYEQLRQHAPRSTELLCFTDQPEEVGRYGIAIERLQHDWPDYWCKMEVYRAPGPCLYLDLDTTIVGDLAPLLDAAERHEFIAIRHRRDDVAPLQGSVLAWSGDASHLYQVFQQSPQKLMWKYRVSRNGPSLAEISAGYTHLSLSKHGVTDQAFVARQSGRDIAMWDDLLPGAVLSYKLEWLRGADRSNCRIVYFHGKPRPWEVTGLQAE